MKIEMKKTPFSFVGKSVRRVDALDKAAGISKYGSDLSFPNMLYACAFRSLKPRIKIKNLSDEKAKKIRGYVGLITCKDIRGKNRWPLVMEDYPFLPERESRFAGETIALVLAKDRKAAKKAASMLKLEHEELPFVDDPLKSMEKGSVKIFGRNNVFSKYVIKKGEALKSLERCKYKIKGEFETNYQVHSYLETQVATAVPASDGSMTIYSSTQCPFYVLDAVCAVTGLSNHRVKVIQTVTGGGFGGKEDMPALVAAHAAICAQKTGKPVRLSYERKEDFMSMSKRHPSYSSVMYGADESGRIRACVIKYVLDSGAYSTLSPIVLWRGSVHAAGPYDIENVLIETYAVATNKVPCGAFRGFGQPQICFAQESLIDDLADKIGMDPVEFRLKNIIRKGSRTVTGQKIDESCGLSEIVNIVRKKSAWDRFGVKREGEKIIALGFANTYYGVGLGAKGRFLDRAGAYINIYKDGSVSVNVGNTEMGQGALTVLTQICAETLNCPLENVHIHEVDTSKVPDSGPTVASRTTIMSGNAIMEAARPLRERIFKTAMEILGSDKVSASGGFFFVGKKRISFAQVVKECWARRLKMSEQGWYTAPKTSFSEKNGKGDSYVVYSYSANAALVEIDIKTFEMKIRKVFAAYDVGKLINPRLALAQAHGGILQGAGWALFENLVYKDGIMLNPGFADYALATSADMPEYAVSFVEKEYTDGPYNAKGIGELPLIAVAPAVRNAVKNALGLRLNKIPMLPENVWSMSKNKKCFCREN